MLRKIMTTFIALAVSACSGGFGTMDGIMGSWMGAPLNEVIWQWGYPHDQQNISGRKVYHWYSGGSFTTPTYTSGSATVIGNTAYINTTTTGGQTFNGSCTRTVEVNKKNIVVATGWTGNDCPFAELLQYADWRRKGGQ